MGVGEIIAQFMKEDYKELVEYLDKKFVKIDDHFVEVDKKFINVEKRLVTIEENKADKTDISNLLNAVDVYAHKADKFFEELVMLSHQVKRHEKWL